MAHLEMDILGENLVWLRKSHGLSKQEIARIMGVGVQTLSKLEHGELPPRMKVEVLFRIQERFGVRVCDLPGTRIEPDAK